MAAKKSTVITAVVGVAIACGAAAFFLLSGPRPATGGAGAPPSSASTVDSSATSTSPEAHEVAEALARLATDPDSLVASSSRSQVGTRAREAVPPGTTVTVHEKSWARDGVGGGAVLVDIAAPGATPVTYNAVVVREADGWKVVATMPLVDPVPTGPTS